MDKEKYLSIKEICKLLKISRPTFYKIRERKSLKEFWVGGRVYFLREDISEISNPTPVVKLEPDKRINLTTFFKNNITELITAPGTIDLRRIHSFDPHGVLALFCMVADIARQRQQVVLEVEDNYICNHLRGLGFFQELEKKFNGKISWNKTLLRTDYNDFQYPITLTNVRYQKEEAPLIAELVKLLREQGFSETIGGYIGWIYGELADNATTYLASSSDPADCYLLAQRFRFTDSRSNCVIISIADIGPGIHGTLKKNPKYSALTNRDAFLSAFKPKVSSWADEFNRGKGLTDILSIAMGNKAILRAESGENVWYADFRNETNEVYQDSNLPKGTRVSLVLIDREFEVRSSNEAENLINKLLVRQ